MSAGRSAPESRHSIHDSGCEPIHRSIEERHTRHERRYCTSVRSSIGCRKKVSVGFDGGQLSSDAGVLLLRGVEKKLGLAGRLASCLRDRPQSRPDRAHGRGDAPASDVCDRGGLRGRRRLRFAEARSDLQDGGGPAAESGEPLCSQPTMSRLENAPSKIEIARMMAAMVDQFCDSYRRAPASITLDIDDTFDAVHGHQQLSLFNAHYDERCFLPIHIYEGTAASRWR